MFTVNFKTQNPIPFRECDNSLPGVDLDLDAFVEGKAEILDYDKRLFRNIQEVENKIKESAPFILKICFASWPEGSSIVRSDHVKIVEMLEKRLQDEGIQTRCKISGLKLTEKSELLYSTSVSLAEQLKRNKSFGALELDNPELSEPSAHSSIVHIDKFCQNCGAKRVPGDKFCPECGRKW